MRRAQGVGVELCQKGGRAFGAWLGRHYLAPSRFHPSGPVAKAFNLSFGKLLEQASTVSVRPNNIWVGDEGARTAVEQLSRDIGMEALYGRPLERAAT